MKALDLRRDPRCVVHSIVTGTAGTEGDVKVYGRAVEITGADPDERRRDRYGAALFARIGWRPTGDFHLFVVDIDEVGYFRVEGAVPPGLALAARGGPGRARDPARPTP